jgi:hypothetical protein
MAYKTHRVVFEGVEYPALAMCTEVMPYAQADERRYFTPPTRVWLEMPDIGWRDLGECSVHKEWDTFYIKRSEPFFPSK